MRALLALLVVALAGSALVGVARADDGPAWRRTTPRAIVGERGDMVVLRVPGGRAWGLQSEALPLQRAGRYVVGANLAVPADRDREAFVRVALYASPLGHGRQRLIVDGALVAAGHRGRSVVSFAAPAWARAAKLRVLVRRARDVPVASQPVWLTLPRLLPGQTWSAVVLREVD